MAKLGEVCLINPKSCALRDDTEVSFVPMTKVGERGEFDASEIKHYSEVKKGFTNFQNDDILFAKITPCMENGKGAIAQNMKNGVGFGSTEFHVLRPDTDKITSEWLYYLTTWKTFRKEAERNMTGSAGQKRVPKTFLENYVVNLPDIDTQKSENKILRKVDDLISLRKQQLTKLDELVKARFVEMFGDPICNSKRWDKVVLKDVCHKITDGEHGSVPRVLQGHPFLNAKHIKKDGSIDWMTVSFVADEVHDKIYKRCNPETDDILMTTTGSIGNIAIVPRICPFSMDRGITLLKINHEKINARYISTLLRFNGLQSIMQANIHASAIGHLFLNQVECLPIILPPLALQNQFAAFVERVDQQKQTVQQSLEKLELMKKALMQEYFG